jgi:outer membrane cobalamin receptor
MRASLRLLGIAALALVPVSGCSHNQWAIPAPDRNVITSEEIQASNASTAWDLVAKLRGNFMHSRGSNSIYVKVNKEPTVFLDNVEFGTLDKLKQIPVAHIAEIRFINGWNTEAKFGPGYIAGVIQVVTRFQ